MQPFAKFVKRFFEKNFKKREFFSKNGNYVKKSKKDSKIAQATVCNY